jgi:hypothetical protein
MRLGASRTGVQALEVCDDPGRSEAVAAHGLMPGVMIFLCRQRFSAVRLGRVEKTL